MKQPHLQSKLATTPKFFHTKPVRMKNKKVLIVDDEENIVFALQLLLNKAGYKVESATNGLSGIRQYTNFKPDVILLDIMMPELDGYETAKQIRELDDKSETKIIFLTAKGTLFDKMKAYENGGDDFIVKPCSNEKILEKVEL